MITVENLIIDFLDKKFPDYTVVKEYQDRYNKFPVITVSESQNTTFVRTMTSGKEEHAEITLDIQIYDNHDDRQAKTNKIAREINDIFIAMGFIRIVTRTVHNLHDSTISRTMVRLRGILSDELYVYTK